VNARRTVNLRIAQKMKYLFCDRSVALNIFVGDEIQPPPLNNIVRMPAVDRPASDMTILKVG
jgi:hypothetical protein